MKSEERMARMLRQYGNRISSLESRHATDTTPNALVRPSSGEQEVSIDDSVSVTSDQAGSMMWGDDWLINGWNG